MFGWDDFEEMLQAAVEGLGIAFLPDWGAGYDINSSALVQLFLCFKKNTRNSFSPESINSHMPLIDTF